MSRFYASISGQAQTEATRRGSGSSGIYGHVRGWSTGIRVSSFNVDDEDGCRDGFSVRLSGGSNGGRRELDIAEVQEDGNGTVRVSVLTQDGGRSVFYVSRDGDLMTQPLTVS